MMQYESQGQGTQGPHRLFWRASDLRGPQLILSQGQSISWVSVQRSLSCFALVVSKPLPPAQEVRCLAERRAVSPPDVTTIYSPLESASGGNDGMELHEGCTAPMPACSTLVVSPPAKWASHSPLQQNVAHACLFASPITVHWWELHHITVRSHSHGDPNGMTALVHISGLLIGSRPADPRSTAVWRGNLLHFSPQPHTGGDCSTFRWIGVLATATKICAGEALQLGSLPAGTADSHVHSTQRCSAQRPHRRWTVRQ